MPRDEREWIVHWMANEYFLDRINKIIKILIVQRLLFPTYLPDIRSEP